MTRSPRRLICAVLLLTALLGLTHLQSTLATFGVVWRGAVLSWDNPATQIVEEIASGVVPLTDPSRLASERLIAAARSRERAQLVEPLETFRDWALARSVTRAPPTA